MKTNVVDTLGRNARAGEKGMGPKSQLTMLLLGCVALAVGGCETPPTGSNPPAVVPNPQPGTPIAGGLQIAYARATPQLADTGHWKTGTVNVHFNGAATTAGVVVVEALPPGWSSLYTRVGSAKFVPGQTDVQVQISVIVEKPANIPLKVLIERSSAEFQTMTHYGGQANFGSHAPGPGFGAGVSGPAVGLDLSGRWFHDGKPTSISVSADGSVTITDEQGRRSSGKMTSNNKLDISGIRGDVSNGGRRISWSNGTEWTR